MSSVSIVITIIIRSRSPPTLWRITRFKVANYYYYVIIIIGIVIDSSARAGLERRRILLCTDDVTIIMSNATGYVRRRRGGNGKLGAQQTVFTPPCECQLCVCECCFFFRPGARRRRHPLSPLLVNFARIPERRRGRLRRRFPGSTATAGQQCVFTR